MSYRGAFEDFLGRAQRGRGVGLRLRRASRGKTGPEEVVCRDNRGLLVNPTKNKNRYRERVQGCSATPGRESGRERKSSAVFRGV